MRTKFARILLVPVVAFTAIALAAPAAHASPTRTTVASQSALDSQMPRGGGGGGISSPFGGNGGNGGLLGLLLGVGASPYQCGLLSLLLGGCQQPVWTWDRNG